jgi:hypothetical protein
MTYEEVWPNLDYWIEHGRSRLDRKGEREQVTPTTVTDGGTTARLSSEFINFDVPGIIVHGKSTGRESEAW